MAMTSMVDKTDEQTPPAGRVYSPSLAKLIDWDKLNEWARRWEGRVFCVQTGCDFRLPGKGKTIGVCPPPIERRRLSTPVCSIDGTRYGIGPDGNYRCPCCGTTKKKFP
ncbi:MAG: hypothetical protein ACLP56_05395 [Candidatus Sulfotelmatobacter sp.]